MPNDADTQCGLVIADHGRRGLLEIPDDEPIPYIVKGRSQRVVCGDTVKWRFDPGENTAIVVDVLERRNALERRPPGNPEKVEVLAANLSCIVVTFAPIPEPDWYLIDRYVCAGEIMACDVIILMNKADLDVTAGVGVDVYANLGYACLAVSAKSGLGLAKLSDALAGKTGILVGQSGVGKSSLINAICPGTNIAVGSISAATAEGKHTTTASRMLSLPSGGRLIDTPGVREFIPAFRNAAVVQSGFREISDASRNCRFSNCQHLREPDCAVKGAVDAGLIAGRRYESYKRVINSL